MPYIPSQDEIRAIKQTVKDVYVKVELLEYKDPTSTCIETKRITNGKILTIFRILTSKKIICRVHKLDDEENIVRTVELSLGDKATYSTFTVNNNAVMFHSMYEDWSAEIIYYYVDMAIDPWVVVDSLTGNLVSDNFSTDSNSIQRRNYTCNLVVSDHARKVHKDSILSEYLVGKDSKIWIDKYVRAYYGIYSFRTKEIIWWLIGTFTYVTANYTFSATECNLSLTCADMMCNYDGTKNGLINQTKYDDITGESAAGFKIPAVAEYELDSSGNPLTNPDGARVVKSYTKIRDSIIALVEHAGIYDYEVGYYPDGRDTIPYDLDFSGEVVYTTVWNSLRDLYPSWEYFFDINGKFIWRKIPTGYNEEVAINDEIINDIYITESTSNSFAGIYNATEVWGKTFSLTTQDRYVDTSTYDSSTNTYTINLPLIAKNGVTDMTSPLSYFVQGDKIGFRVFHTNSIAPYLQIVDSTTGTRLTRLQIVDSGGEILPANAIAASTTGKICVFTYRQNVGNSLDQQGVYLNGQTQAYGYYEETNPDCPFSVVNIKKNVHRIVKETLFSDDLCYNQAEYETYKTCAMKDTINLTMVIVPWLEVNQKVEYTSKLTGETNQYIITNLSWSTLDGTMTMSMYRFLEDFEYVKGSN